MHRDFRKRLAAAKGVSEFPIALNVDIREFSKWSGDSAESGLFIKKVYIRLIDEYFADASFYKATGDGLLAIFPVDEDNPKAAVRAAVKRAMDIVRKFPSLTDGDPMINFPTPQKVGVGLARGPASRLISGRKTLDYSGATLNLASRLMDIARPQGVVLDGGFGIELLTPSVASKFSEERVYLKGVAPNTGSQIFFTPDWTDIPESVKSPLDDVRWGKGIYKATRTQLEAMEGLLMLQLDCKPKDSSEMRCFVKHNAVDKSGKRMRKKWMSLDLLPPAFSYEETADGPALEVDLAVVQVALQRMDGGHSFPVEVRAEFVAE
jgi:hypothetical protein